MLSLSASATVGSLVLSLVTASQQATPGPTSSSGEVPSVHISGRFNPELIPQPMLWEAFLRDAATADTNTVDLPRDKRINGLSKYTWKISVADVERVVAIAVKTVKAIDDLRQQLLTPSLSDAQRSQLLNQSNDLAMQGRDALATTLSAATFKTIRTYVTEEYVKGIEVELPASPQ